MSDKSRDAEPGREDLVTGASDAAEESENDTLSIFDIDDPEALEEAEEAVEHDPDAIEVVPPSDDVDPEADDETIAELEENFTPEERAAAAAVPIARKTAKAPVRKKDTATRKRSASTVEHDDPYKAHNPAEFVAQSAAELKRVVWPTWPQTVSMFSAVLIFVLIMILIVGALDFAFTWGLLKMLGSK